MRSHAAVASFLLCMTAQSQAAPFLFLKKSKLLENRKIRLIVAESLKDKVYVQELADDDASSKKWLLGDDGRLHPLTGSGTDPVAFLKWGCGDAETGVTFSTNGEEPAGELSLENGTATGVRLVALGENVEAALQWYPLSKLNQAIDVPCAVEPGMHRESTSRYTSKNLPKGRGIFFSEFTADKSSAPAGECPPYAANMLGTYGPKNSCLKWITDVLDCDGMSKYSLGKPFGLLLVKEGKNSEQWLILESSGHESHGFMALPFAPDRAPEMDSIDYLHYTGC